MLEFDTQLNLDHHEERKFSQFITPINIGIIKLKKDWQALSDVFPAMPERGKAYHLVSHGYFNSYAFVPVIASLFSPGLEFWVSMWSINREALHGLIELGRRGNIKTAHILVGLYYQQREAELYGELVQACHELDWRCMAFKNHCKVMMFTDGRDHIVIETSANWTANPRMEQFTITNHEGLYRFHAEWMEDQLNAGGPTDKTK